MMDEKELNSLVNEYINLHIFTEEGTEYKILDFICCGGNGLIFNCMNSFNNEFIVKILYKTNEEKREKFRKEIKLLKSVDSEYIVKCKGVGSVRPHGKKIDRPFYLMNKYDCSLEDMLENDEVSPINAFNFILQICYGIRALHKRKIPFIHRDLKPSNILFDKKNNRVLISDFGLVHLDNGNDTITTGFAGNIDYHAPEQKIRGKQKIGTYTDIYSLGLIMNVLFTKEIAQGEGYKKIFDVSPHFGYLDKIIERMIKHDILKRESDIDTIIFELEKHQSEYEFEEAILNHDYEEIDLNRSEIDELMDLLALSNHLYCSDTNWDLINLNYKCDYHFSCDEKITSVVLLIMIYERVKYEFEYESKCLEENKMLYKPLLNENDFAKTYFDFCSIVDNLIIYKNFNVYRNYAKKYFYSIAYHHAMEVVRDINSYKELINHNCNNAPILWATSFVFNKLSAYKEAKILPSNFLSLVYYSKSDVSDKNELYVDKYGNFKKLSELIQLRIGEHSTIIENKKLKVFFGDLHKEDRFEKFIKEISKKLGDTDVRSCDLLDIISNCEINGLKKIYIIDSPDADTILESSN